MTRTLIRHTLSTLAALALVSAVATSAVAGDKRMRTQHYHDELVTGQKGIASKKSTKQRFKQPMQMNQRPGEYTNQYGGGKN